MCIFLRAALSAFLKTLLFLCPSWSTFCHWLPGQPVALGFRLSLLTVSFLRSFGSSFLLPLASDDALPYPGYHPESSSVDNCLFAPPCNYHLYCSDTSLLLGTSLLDPIFLTSNWMSSFGCLLHSCNSVHQEMKGAFSSQTCFSSQRSCLIICARESENLIFESQLTIFSCLITLASTSKTMLACSWS